MIAVLLGLTAAAALAAAAVLQHDAASTAPAQRGLGAGVKLLGRLLRRRRWLTGQLLGAAGLATFAVALHLGRVVVVQPLLATQLVFSLLLAGALARRRHGRAGLDAALWGAAALVVGGLVVFGLTARPSVDPDGTDVDALRGTWLLGSAGVALVAQLVAGAVGHRLRAGRRCLLLAVTAAVGFGVDALLLKAVGAHLAAGEWLSWPLLALAVLAPSSLVTAQRAFQAGAVTQALPAIAALEPVVAITLAGPALGEHLASGAGWRAGQVAGLVALLAGVVVLARRGPWATASRPPAAEDDEDDDGSGQRDGPLRRTGDDAPARR
ncbi:DMT family transporter [Quadrisphaera setariae]|uniref:Threonine/homoserine efflux transporter RhtA n=1 Tax=Quadrisphaera setariae TaxID=2593304 RepID=A0A5C8ZEW1_9ACTN|nr:DMT family transporter [Quadrisphaera setariae]TXR55456.1 hypothetical protein FMM08_14130 [Quadrisphaera setariae]